MNVWCHLPTIFSRRYTLRLITLVTLFIALITTLLFDAALYAAPGVNQTIGFQGRLSHATGGIVADGHYNIQFKIYQDGAGTAAGNPGGTLKWTESYTNNLGGNGGVNNGVQVKNGYFTVSLGSITPFGSSVDWNQDTLWISMNVAGTSSTCSTFGSGSCTADGEMLPMKRVTSAPYALNSAALGGKTASNFIQLAQGVQTDASTNTSSIFINKTSTGNFIQLQRSAVDVFTVNNSGSLTLGNNADQSITVAASASADLGKNLSVIAGMGGNGGGGGRNGGSLILQGGAGGGSGSSGGDVQIDAGAAGGIGSVGSITIGTTRASSIVIGSVSSALAQTINIGANNTSGGSATVTIGTGSSASSGTTNIQAKNTVVIKTNGTTRATFSDSANTVYFGNGVSSSLPTSFTIQGTNSSSALAAGGALTIQGGSATAGNANGGNVTIAGGAGFGTGVRGLVVLSTPAFSTVTNDANCYTSGALVAASCTIAASSVNNSSAVIVGFSNEGQTATLPDPTVTTAGRVVYVMAATGSEDLTLSANSGAREITMREKSAATMMWNGADWVVAGNAGPSVVQDMYNSDSDTVNVQIGDGTDDGNLTLFTLDRADAAPSISDAALLGSMYYDTTLDQVQCYMASGWGPCTDMPDNFVTISPQYPNAVMNGASIGTITSDLCSDTLNINDGSSGQPTICATNETQNYYQWTTTDSGNQTRSIYISYQLPSNFDNFVAGSTSLMAFTDALNSSVTMQIYRDNSSGLTSCGTATTISSGSKSAWQTTAPSGGADPANCSFAAGEGMLIKISLSTRNNKNAYTSDLKFTYSTN